MKVNYVLVMYLAIASLAYPIQCVNRFFELRTNNPDIKIQCDDPTNCSDHRVQICFPNKGKLFYKNDVYLTLEINSPNDHKEWYHPDFENKFQIFYDYPTTIIIKEKIN